MKYLKEYNSNGQSLLSIDAICKEYDIVRYKINPNRSIDVYTKVDLSYNRLDRLPLNFANVRGSFYCNGNILVNLEGSPQSVGSIFNCASNRLLSLKGAPKTVDSHFQCRWNELRDLYNIPKVKGLIDISGNPVYSLTQYFINRPDKNEWIELFNELDIVQDRYNVILDRLKYFYEGTKLNLDVNKDMLYRIKMENYKII